MKLYVDTCVYLDLINYNNNYSFEDYSQEVYEFFNIVMDLDFKVIFSRWVKEELERKLKEKQIDNSIFDDLFDNLDIIDLNYDEKQKAEAERLSPNNWQDQLHVILAKKANALMIVTQNIRDFKEFCKGIEYMNTRTFIRKYS